MYRSSFLKVGPRRRIAMLGVVFATALVGSSTFGLGAVSAQMATEPGISVIPTTVAASGSVVVTVELPASCGAFIPTSVPVDARPTGAASAAWSTTIAVNYDVATHGYRASTTVAASTLLAANAQRGSWTATASFDDVICGETFVAESATFTIEPLATTTTAAPPTTAAPVTTTTALPPYQYNHKDWSGPTTSIKQQSTQMVFKLAEDANGRIEIRIANDCTYTYSDDGMETKCVTRGSMVAVAGSNGLFAPGTEVVLFLFSDPTRVGSTTSNAGGGFDTEFRVPNLPAGQHTLVASGIGPDGRPVSYKLPIEIEGTATGELAFTGSNQRQPWLAVGGLLAILLGAVMIVATLRPEPLLAELRSLRPIEPLDPTGRRGRRTRRPTDR